MMFCEMMRACLAAALSRTTFHEALHKRDELRNHRHRHRPATGNSGVTEPPPTASPNHESRGGRTRVLGFCQHLRVGTDGACCVTDATTVSATAHLNLARQVELRQRQRSLFCASFGSVACRRATLRAGGLHHCVGCSAERAAQTHQMRAAEQKNSPDQCRQCVPECGA